MNKRYFGGGYENGKFIKPHVDTVSAYPETIHMNKVTHYPKWRVTQGGDTYVHLPKAVVRPNGQNLYYYLIPSRFRNFKPLALYISLGVAPLGDALILTDVIINHKPELITPLSCKAFTAQMVPLVLSTVEPSKSITFVLKNPTTEEVAFEAILKGIES